MIGHYGPATKKNKNPDQNAPAEHKTPQPTSEGLLHAECKRLEAALGECRARNAALRAGCKVDRS